MTGRIVFEPKVPTACERGNCEGKPRADDYRDGTIWECDHWTGLDRIEELNTAITTLTEERES